MGSSFTNFRERGFWSHDPLLEAWLRIVSLHLEEAAQDAGWVRELRAQWMRASTGYFGGWVTAALDDLLTDDARIAAVLKAADRAIVSLRAFGPYVPAAFRRAIALSVPSSQDWPIEWFELIADRFTKLLRGELTTDATTSPTLPATYQGQRWDEGPQPRPAEGQG
jgi:hypothetical protein